MRRVQRERKESAALNRQRKRKKRRREGGGKKTLCHSSGFVKFNWSRLALTVGTDSVAGGFESFWSENGKLCNEIIHCLHTPHLKCMFMYMYMCSIIPY